MVLVELFSEFCLLSAMAFGGGNALLPEIHRVVVDQHHWMDAATFTHLYAIAQAAPGPNILIVALIGWQVAGLAGALTATLAMCLPMSIVVYVLIGHWERFRGRRWQRAIAIGVAPLAVGLLFSGSTLIGLALELDGLGWAFVLLVVLVSVRTKLHPLWFIATGAVLGLAGVF